MKNTTIHVGDKLFEINGNNRLFFVMQKSLEILDLEENWNDEGALAIEPEILEKALRILYDLHMLVKEHDATKYLLPPNISPSPDNSVDIVWNVGADRICLYLSITKEDDIGVVWKTHEMRESFLTKNRTLIPVITNFVLEFLAE